MYIELRHLRTVKAIHEAGGLARAADMLNMTQSALSHQVKGLEDQTGVELFVRRSKPMTPVGGGPAVPAGGGAGAARGGRAGRGFPRAAVGQVGAAAHRHRMPCLFRLAVPGAGAVPPGLA